MSVPRLSRQNYIKRYKNEKNDEILDNHNRRRSKHKRTLQTTKIPEISTIVFHGFQFL